MPDLTGRLKKKIEVDFGNNEVLKITFKPSQLTPNILDDLAEKAAAAEANPTPAPTPSTDAEAKDKPYSAQIESLRSFTQMQREIIAGSVIEWDLTDGGEPVPLTVEGMKKLDLPLISAIVRAMREDQSVPPTNGADSTTPS